MAQRQDWVKVYRRKGAWRWTFYAGSNGKKLANGGQGYTRKFDCLKGLRRVINAGERLEIVVHGGV